MTSRDSAGLTLADRFNAGELKAQDRRTIARLIEHHDRVEESRAARRNMLVAQRLYFYTGFVVKAYDADTITVNLDIGFGNIEPAVEFRFYGINANEIRRGSPEHRAKGREARDYVRSLILERAVLIRTHIYRGSTLKPKKGKFGRFLVEVFCPDETGRLFNLNEHLVDRGLAEFNTYGDKFIGWTTVD